jgi:hypothetical protein
MDEKEAKGTYKIIQTINAVGMYCRRYDDWL